MKKKGDRGENEDRNSVLTSKVLIPDTSFCAQPHLQQHRPPPALLVDCELFKITHEKYSGRLYMIAM